MPTNILMPALSPTMECDAIPTFVKTAIRDVAMKEGCRANGIRAIGEQQ
jgi:hypothetical protein